jgi:hypothetical protein
MSPFPRRRQFEFEDIGSVAVGRFTDTRIVHEPLDYFGNDLDRLVDELNRRKVLLNFSNVESVADAVLGRLITLHRKYQSAQGKLVLCSIPADILAGFKTAEPGGVLTVVTDPGLATQDDVIREVFGDPYRDATLSPEWRTDTAVLLAKQMYDARDFSAMPILADALEDANCTDEAILAHCRGNSPHCRGCHVLDAILNKS